MPVMATRRLGASIRMRDFRHRTNKEPLGLTPGGLAIIVERAQRDSR